LKRILVTGGTGFLGSHLVDSLVKRGDSVRILARPESRLDFIQDHVNNASVEIVRGDLTDPCSLKRACDSVQMIFHAGAAVRLQSSPYTFRTVNSDAMRSLLVYARENNVERFIHVSSIGLYGWNSEPINEQSEQKTTNAYEESKLQGEIFVLDAYQRYGLPVVIIQPSAIYGPRARIIMPELFWYLQKSWLPYIDEGKHRLNMVYVSDVVDAMISASENEKAVGERFVIGHEYSPTYREIIETTAEILGRPSPYWSIPYMIAKPFAVLIQKAASVFNMEPFPFSDYLEYTVLDGVLDISKAKRVLGFDPKVGLQEGMIQTVSWFREHTDLLPETGTLPVAEGFTG
jgi:nucleoside-diphosphate-sugar epimerase